VSWVLGVVAATLGGLLLWGLFSPRGIWRTLTGWSVSDPHGNEPGAVSYGIRRLVSAVGALGVAGVLLIAGVSFIGNLPQPAPPKSDIAVMWGEPDPEVVNRVVTAIPTAPTDLPGMPVLGYQPFGDNGAPSYLTRLKQYSLLSNPTPPGLIGSQPDEGFAAIDTAELVINVRGPILCIPRQAVVVETETTIQIGIFYGLPDSADGSAIDQLASCPADAALTASLLIPIALSTPVGDREVQNLDGTPIDKVKVVSSSD